RGAGTDPDGGAAALNIGVTAWSPLANGVLTGKYHGHGSSEPGRMSTDMLKDFMPEQQRTERIVGAVKTVSDETGRSMAQVGLAGFATAPCRSSLSSAHESFRSCRTILRAST